MTAATAIAWADLVLRWTIDLGDLGVIAPSALVVAGVLLVAGAFRQAAGWALALGATFAVTFASKAAIGGFSVEILGHAVEAASFPSGHTSMSVAFWGGLALLAQRSGRLPARLAALPAIAVAALVPAAVWRLGWHPAADIAAGLLLAFAVLAAWRRSLARHEPPPAFAALAAAAVVALACHGLHLETGGERIAAVTRALSVF